jgi:hypothetical protein
MGTPLRTPEQMLDYLLTNVRMDDVCRVWASCVTTNGMPKVSWKCRAYNAQRLLLTLLDKNPKARVWSICGNRTCMEPDHLTTGSVGQHNQWMFDTGVFPKGRQRAMRIALGVDAKLGVRALPMLHRLRAEGRTYKQIGERMGVHPSTVGHLLRRWM